MLVWWLELGCSSTLASLALVGLLELEELELALYGSIGSRSLEQLVYLQHC